MEVEKIINKDTIFIVVPHLAGGGQERIAAQTADLLTKYFNVKLIIFSANKNVYTTNVEIINLNVSSERSILLKIYQQIKRIIKLHRLKKKYQPRIIYSIGNTANITNVFSGGPGKKIVSLRGYANIKNNFIDKIVYILADSIICISKAMSVRLSNIFPNIIEKIEVLYNGIDLENIHYQLMESTDIIELPKSKKIVSVGRLTDVKGFRQLIKSFNKLLELEKDISLIIIGEGENREELEKLIQCLNLQDHVFLLGFKNNVYTYLKECDLFVLSSVNEGFGNVIVEAMVCGLPILSTACLSGPAEILGSENYDIRDITYCEFGVLVPSFESDKSDEEYKTDILKQAMYEMITNEEIVDYYKKQSVMRAKDFSLECYENNIMRYLFQL